MCIEIKSIALNGERVIKHCHINGTPNDSRLTTGKHTQTNKIFDMSNWFSFSTSMKALLVLISSK